MPIDLAVLAMIFFAGFMSLAFKSSIFSVSMSSSCLLEPFSGPAALRMRRDAGGFLTMKSKLRSLYTFMTTGRILPASGFVCVLNWLTNSPMLTPAGPSAVPTGGAGVAAPAGICNLIILVTCFAMSRHYTRNGYLFQVFELRTKRLRLRVRPQYAMVGKMHPAKEIDPGRERFDGRLARMQIKLQSFPQEYIDMSAYVHKPFFFLRENDKIVGVTNVVFRFELVLHELIEFVHVDVDEQLGREIAERQSFSVPA